MAAADLHAGGEELDDEALRGLTEADLARLMAALQADHSGAFQEEDIDGLLHVTPSVEASAASSSAVPDQWRAKVGDAEVDPLPGEMVASTRFAMVSPIAVAGLLAFAAVCVAALLALVLKAGDPCEQRMEQKCGSLRWRLEAAEHERDALRKELQKVVAERERLSQEIDLLYLQKPSSTAGQMPTDADKSLVEIGQQLRISPAQRPSTVSSPQCDCELSDVTAGVATTTTTCAPCPAPVEPTCAATTCAPCPVAVREPCPVPTAWLACPPPKSR
jgi:hypothetical protein